MFKKVVLPVIGIIFVVLISIFIVISYDINGVVKNQFEKKLSQALLVDVKISKVDISLIKGRVTVKDLQIGNPIHNKSHEDLIKISELDLFINLWSVFEQTLEIKEIMINKMGVFIDFDFSSNNFKHIISNLKNKVHFHQSKKEKNSEGAKKDSKGILIKSLFIKTLNLHTKVSMIEGGVNLQNIHFTNLGKNHHLDFDQALLLIFEDIYKKVIVDYMQHPSINVDKILKNLKNTFKKSAM